MPGMREHDVRRALYGPPTTGKRREGERVYTGGMCATHGPVEADQHGRCSLCGLEAPRPDGGALRVGRDLAVEKAHEEAIREDAVRDVIAAELVPVPGHGRVLRSERWKRA